MYQLYGAPGHANFAPHACLIKADVEHEFVTLDIKNKEHHGEDFMKLNPNGRIPVLIDHGIAAEPLVLYETAAICLHIADRHPDAGLFPAIGTVERACAYKWLMYLTNTVQTELLVFYYNIRYTSDENCVEANKIRMAERIADMYAIMAEEPNIKNGFMAGDAPSICDYFMFMISDWTADFDIADGPKSYPVLVDYLARVKALPEVQATLHREGFEPAI